MTQKDLFTMLGAPLANPRWSWGSVRKDGVVFLRVWQDRVRKCGGSLVVRLTREAERQSDATDHGYHERLRHVELIKQGAPCYMIMCEAADVDARPREVKDFNQDEVFPGGKLVQKNGAWWIELRRRIPVRQVMPSSEAD